MVEKIKIVAGIALIVIGAMLILASGGGTETEFIENMPLFLFLHSVIGVVGCLAIIGGVMVILKDVVGPVKQFK